MSETRTTRDMTPEERAECEKLTRGLDADIDAALDARARSGMRQQRMRSQQADDTQGDLGRAAHISVNDAADGT